MMALPPLLVQVGSTELLYSDAVRIARQAEDAGVDCQLQVWERMPHVFHALAAWLPEAGQALQEIGAVELHRRGDELAGAFEVRHANTPVNST